VLTIGTENKKQTLIKNINYMKDLIELSKNEHKISELKKDANGNDIRIVAGKEIKQIEEKTQADIDLNRRINLWRMR